MNYKKITSQIFSTYAISIATIFTSFFFFLAVTKEMSKEEFGILSIFLSLISFIFPILNFSIGEFFVKDLAGLSVAKKLSKIRSITPLLTRVSLIILLASAFFGDYFLGFMKLYGYFSEFLIVLAIIFILIATYPIQYFLTSNKSILSSLSISYFQTQFWMIFVIILALITSVSVRAVLMSYLLTALFIFLASFLFFFKRYALNYFFTPKVDYRYLKKALFFSLPLIPFLMSQWVLVALDRYFIKYYHTAEEVGVYSYVYSFFTFFSAISIAILLVFYPYLAELMKKNKEKFYFMFSLGIKYSYAILIPALLGFYALKSEIFTMLSGEKYLSALPLIPYLLPMAILLTLSNYLEKPLMLRGETKAIAQIYILGTLTNVLLNFLLIPKYSTLGASIATLLSYALISLLIFYKSNKHILWRFDVIKPFRIIFASAMMFLAVVFLHPDHFLTKMLAILLGVLVYAVSSLAFGVFEKKEISLLKSFLGIKK